MGLRPYWLLSWEQYMLQMSSLACKCIVYGLEHNAKGNDPMELNFERLEMQK